MYPSCSLHSRSPGSQNETQKTIRLEDELEEKVEKYLDANGIKFAHLVNLAIEKFINEPHTISLLPVDEKDFAQVATKAFKKHKSAMDKLK